MHFAVERVDVICLHIRLNVVCDRSLLQILLLHFVLWHQRCAVPANLIGRSRRTFFLLLTSERVGADLALLRVQLEDVVNAMQMVIGRFHFVVDRAGILRMDLSWLRSDELN